MSTFDDTIRTAIASGRLQGLTLFASAQHGWQANARWGGNEGWTVEHDKDPVVAMTKALATAPNFAPWNIGPVVGKDNPGKSRSTPAAPAPELKGGLFD